MDWVGGTVKDWLDALAALNGGVSPVSRATLFRWSKGPFVPPTSTVPGSGQMTRVESFVACYSATVGEVAAGRQARAAEARTRRWPQTEIAHPPVGAAGTTSPRS
ncbi:MAG: hypothetical protein KIT14_12595 [bacterium]|nr:hypothetical protein [bacterium]